MIMWDNAFDCFCCQLTWVVLENGCSFFSAVEHREVRHPVHKDGVPATIKDDSYEIFERPWLT